MLQRIKFMFGRGKPPAKFLAGVDLQGNHYYEIPTSGSRPRRQVDLEGKYAPLDYINAEIVAPWRAWLAGTRKDAPTVEELKALREQGEILRVNVAKLAAEERARLVDEIGEEAVRQREEEKERQQHLGIVDHANAFRSVQHKKVLLAPERRGDAFEPAHWQPAKIVGGEEEMQGEVRAKAPSAEKGDDFQPEEWTPESSDEIEKKAK